MQPLISIVTVVYNSVETIEKTIQSVITQTYPNIEYIIIDGGSHDGTVDVIKKYAKHLSFWISEPDKGIYDAMNKAISHAKGEWVNFMNAGDLLFHPQTLERIFTNSQIKEDVLYSDAICHYPVSDLYVHVDAGELSVMTERMPFCHQTAFVRLELMKQYRFDTSYKILADYNFFHQLFQRGDILFKKCPGYHAVYSMDGISSSKFCWDEFKRINGKGFTFSQKIRRSICMKFPPALVIFLLKLTGKVRIVDLSEIQNRF